MTRETWPPLTNVDYTKRPNAALLVLAVLCVWQFVVLWQIRVVQQQVADHASDTRIRLHAQQDQIDDLRRAVLRIENRLP